MITKAASFFPNTHITPAGLARCGVFFEQVLLYRLPLSQVMDLGDDAGNGSDRPAGLSLIEADFIKDDAEVKRILADFNRWAETYRDPKYLSILRGSQQEEDIEQSETKLISAIRGRSSSVRAEPDPRREAQIFLHFARELDRQYMEINDIFAKVQKEEQLLGKLMGAEPFEDDPEIPDHGPNMSQTNGPGADIMPRRLAAWGQFYAVFGPFGHPLATDQPEALAVMDLNLARIDRTRDLPPAGTMEVIEPFMEISLADPVDENGHPAGSGISALGHGPEWNKLVEKVLSGPITSDQLVGLREEAAGLAARTNTLDRGGRMITLTGYLLPGRDLKNAYLAAAGISPDKPEKGVYCGPVFEIKAG